MISFVPFQTTSTGGVPRAVRHHDCAWCRRRTKLGEVWVEAEEAVLLARRDVSSHGICPSCSAKERTRL